LATGKDENEISKNLNQREKDIARFNMLREQDKDRLHKELQADHQKVLYRETQSGQQEKEHWRQLRMEIEKQAQSIMTEDKLAYQKLAMPLAPKPTVVKNTVLAFIVGGLICVIGQLIMDFSLGLGMTEKEAGAVTASALVFGGALLTGLGLYDELGRFAGAGSIVPISGFANSIAAAALEFKREGFIYGVGARIFTVAGPVIAYGLIVSIFVGLVYYFVK